MRGASVVGVWSRWALHADAVVDVLGSRGLRVVVVDDPWTHPGVLVAEAVMPEDVALVAQRAKGEHPTIVWGGTLPVPKVAALRSVGAAAYVPMLEHPRELAGVVTDVVAGVSVAWGESRLPKSGLTPRERTVARAYLVEHAEWGRSQVAKHLGMSENTLKVHIANIRTKAGHRGTHTREGLRRALIVRGELDESGNRQGF